MNSIHDRGIIIVNFVRTLTKKNVQFVIIYAYTWYLLYVVYSEKRRVKIAFEPADPEESSIIYGVILYVLGIRDGKACIYPTNRHAERKKESGHFSRARH